MQQHKDHPLSTQDDQPEGRKTNIIVTYAELQGINLGVQRIDGKVDFLTAEVKRIGEEHTDHEIRIRALELTQARASGGAGMAQWATPILLTIFGIGMTVLNYLK
jgi:hypothetical protein